MIVKEFYLAREDGINLYRTYSDANFQIRKVGTNEIYDEAVDVEGAPYTYEETDILIPIAEEEQLEEFVEENLE